MSINDQYKLAEYLKQELPVNASFSLELQYAKLNKKDKDVNIMGCNKIVGYYITIELPDKIYGRNWFDFGLQDFETGKEILDNFFKLLRAEGNFFWRK